MMAARSLIVLYREQIPGLLHKRDRGRPTEAQADIKQKNYGEVVAADHIPGSEALLKKSKTVSCVVSYFCFLFNVSYFQIDVNSDDSSSDEDGEWVDIPDDGNNESKLEEDDGEFETDEDASIDSDDEEEEDDVDDDEEAAGSDKDVSEAPDKSKKSGVQIMDEKQAAQELALTRLFTDEDFKRIDAENIKKHTTNARKRPLEAEKSEYVRLDDIEMIYKKRRADKQTRLESVLKGRTGREKFGYRDGRQNIHCSKTNTEKTKKKNFGMMRHKARSKVKRSFKDKQQEMRKHLLKQKKMK